MDCARGCIPPPPDALQNARHDQHGHADGHAAKHGRGGKDRMETISSRLRPMRRAIQPEAGSMMALETR